MKNILVIDDDVQVLSSLEKALQSYGFTVIAKRDGLDITRILIDNEIHLALIDLILPGPTGIEVIKHIRSVAPDVTVFALTGYPLIYSRINTRELGISECLTKPCNMSSILTRINRCINN